MIEEREKAERFVCDSASITPPLALDSVVVGRGSSTKRVTKSFAVLSIFLIKENYLSPQDVNSSLERGSRSAQSDPCDSLSEEIDMEW